MVKMPNSRLIITVILVIIIIEFIIIGIVNFDSIKWVDVVFIKNLNVHLYFIGLDF